MSRVHSKHTVVLLDAVDISEHCNTSSEEDTLDSHDLTVYGKSRKVKGGGLGDGTFSLGGFYDSSVDDGPRPLFKGIQAAGETVEMIYRPEGTGSGKPQTRVQVLSVKYSESAPVADFRTWSADLEMSDDIDDDPQA